MLVFCASLASAQTKTVGQLVADVKRGDEPALQRLIMMGTAGNAEVQVNLGTLYEQGSRNCDCYVTIRSTRRMVSFEGLLP